MFSIKKISFLNKKPLIVIHIDALQREFLASWLLGESLKKNGFRVLLTSRHSTNRFLKGFAPNIFISSHVFQLSPSMWKNLHQKETLLYINECEGSNHLYGNLTTYPKKYSNQKINYKLFKKFFVWNLYTKKWLKKNRKVKNCFAIGSIRQSSFLQTNAAKKNKVVGLIARFEVINTFDRRPFFENLFKVQPENKNDYWYFDRCGIDAEALAIYIKFLILALKKGFSISIRPHPNENHNVYKYIKNQFPYGKIEIDESLSIHEWIQKVSLIFGTPSSGFTEPYLKKIPIISTSAIQRFKFAEKKQSMLYNNFDYAAYKPKSIKQAGELLSQKNLAPKNSKYFHKFLKNFYNFQNKYDPITEIIEHIKHDSSKMKAKSLFFYFVSFLYLLFIDFFGLCKYVFVYAIFFKSDHLLKYNYNRIIHAPTKFMKSIRNKL